jgi:hypothetical protein
MKLDAYITFSDTTADKINHDEITIAIDSDYVSADKDDINEWVINELETQFNIKFMINDFTITNIDDIIEEINYEEFMAKTN